MPEFKLFRAVACFFLLTAPILTQAAPYELRVYTDEISAPDEIEAETLFSIAKPRSNRVSTGRVDQMLVEINYGLAKGFEVGLEAPAVYTNQSHKLEGLALEFQYVAPHTKSEGWYLGVRGDLGRVASVYEDDTALSLEINPIVGYAGQGYKLVFNPSFEKALNGKDMVTKFQPAGKFALRASPKDEVGIEYFSNWGRVAQLLPQSQRDETWFLAWDKKTSFGRLNMGIGQPLHTTSGSVDSWVAKFGIQFDAD